MPNGTAQMYVPTFTDFELNSLPILKIHIGITIALTRKVNGTIGPTESVGRIAPIKQTQTGIKKIIINIVILIFIVHRTLPFTRRAGNNENG